MNRRLPVLCIFFTLLSCVLSQSPVLILGTSSTYFVFSTEFFQQFHECLCGADSRSCNADVGDGYLDNYFRAYDVTNIDAYDTYRPDQYSDRYECSLFGDRSSGTVYWVGCERQRNRDIKGPPASSLPCQSLRVTCSGRCVDVLWSTNRSFWLRGEDIQLVSCGSCELETYTGPTTTTTTSTTTRTTTTSPTSAATSTTTKATTTSTFDKQKGDDPNDDNIPLIAGVVVAVIVVLAIAGVIIIILWRRKRNLKPPSIPHHYTTSTGAISHNYENTGHRQEHVNENGRLATNPYVIDDSDSTQATSPQQQAGQTVVDSYVSQEEVIKKKRAAAAANNSNTGNQGTESSSIDQDVPEAVISPVIGPHNDTGSAPDPSSATPASTTYSRLGEPVRNIQNPYDVLPNPCEYSVAKSTPANNNTAAQYSLAGQAPSPSSTQDSQTVHSSSPSGQPTNRNAYGYEEVGVNNMTTPVVSNDYEESPTYASSDNKDGAESSKEPDYTNFPVNEHVAAKHDYAKLGEPVRNIQNPYDVMV